jgi:PIN domain nuclease of toxin-antitoxin system
LSDVVLDASALLALVHGEHGAERVLAVLDGAAISAANLAEVVSRLAERGRQPASIRRQLARLPLDIVAVDEDLGYAAGFLRPSTRAHGLSLGDRICLALAGGLGATALTADRAWARLGSDVRIELLRPS